MSPTDRAFADTASGCLPFSIFIPTYNRAHLLPKALQSIAAQTYPNFEVIIIDDGSTDTTEALISDWQADMPFVVVYRKQRNQGKMAAHNAAVTLARGELFVLLDSDDTLLPDSLQRLHTHWSSIPAERRAQFSGVEGHTQKPDGNISGDWYPQDRMVSNFLTLHYQHGIGGEKKGAIRTDLLRQHLYPVFPGETHIRDSILWEDLAERYHCLYVNEVFQTMEYQPDGLSANIFQLRMRNPNGFRHYYRQELKRSGHYYSRRHRLDSYHRFIRFSLHSGIDLHQQWYETSDKTAWLCMLPKGVFKWLCDCWRMQRQKIRAPSA